MTTDYPIQRPPSEQLVDLHVYLLPREVWNEKYSSTYNESISEARSAGFVRVWPDLTVSGLRMVIEEQLGNDLLPPNYTFLRSVGRCMTQVKPKQELELKCKAFLPPTAWAPEIVVLESQRDSMSVPVYQSFPGYSPRHDATQPISGIPTHFPQVANHDRMAPPNDGILRHITHSTLVPGDSPTIHPASIPAPIGQRLPLSSSHHPNPPHPQHPTHTQNANLTNNALDAAQRSDHNHRGAVNPDNHNGSRRIDNPNTSANNSASFHTVPPLHNIAHSPDVLVVKSQSRSHPRQSTHVNAKKSHPISSHPADPTNTQSNSDDDTSQVADVASPTNKRTTNNSPGENVDHDTTPATSAITGHHHTNNLHHHNNIHQSGSRRLSRNDSSSVPFSAPLSATPPDTPTSDTPPPGQSPMVQQQQGYKGDPLQSMVGIPGKSGRPDAYTNNTNEDSGIAEPTPDDDDDPDYERRKSDMDDQYYNQLHPNQTQNEQFKQGERRGDQSDEYQEKEIEEEQQRQAEIQQREEERRKEEERIEAERQREEVRREHDRKLEQKRREDAKKQRQREEEQRKEEKMKEEMERARKEEAERLFEEERRQSIAEREERERAVAFDGVMPLDEGDDDYDDVAMETNQALDSRGHFLNDEQLRRRAEDELQDYEPQSTWKQDGEGGGAEMGHLAHPGRKNRSREDTEMEMASQQAVQDGLKRVHLTPEVHRKAKIGKIRNDSVTDEEDIYETDPEMADLLEQLQLAREERMKKEKERENLIKRARDLQTKTYERRNRSLNETKPRSSSKTPDQATHPRDYWKKRFYDEKKKTAPLEEQGNRVRNQLEVMHRKLLSHVEGKKKGVSVKGPPSKKNNHKIAILKMQHELDELKRKVDNSRMKLTSEIKLRNQTEAEVRGLKGEVTQRKINMTLIRNQKLAALKTGDNKLLSKTPVPALGQGPMSMSAKR